MMQVLRKLGGKQKKKSGVEMSKEKGKFEREKVGKKQVVVNNDVT